MKQIIIALFLMVPAFVGAEEQIDNTTPVVADPRSATFFKVIRLDLNWRESYISIRVSDGGIEKSFAYSGDTARQMMIALNKANLSVKSLQRRILERLIADGSLSGTISGLPD